MQHVPTEIIATVSVEDMDGVAYVVARITGGYSASIFDTDADQSLTTRVFPDATPDRAIEFALHVATPGRSGLFVCQVG